MEAVDSYPVVDFTLRDSHTCFFRLAKVDLAMVQVDADLITDWQTFHSVFAETFGFPGFYGRNMDAWVDCLCYLDDPGAEMSSVHVQSGQTLLLVIENAQGFKRRSPGQFEALVECAGFVNWRMVVAGGAPLLALAFNV
ncbi:barstar family protein [Pseudomonas sp. P7548]|uniref:barstar family protein n=1 Tax=Pseudomonas sp. P7548 TaxID=2726981 RepID=UPI002116EA49|nr:barstar family protein [Pseudomonas sp. P7548]